MSLCLVVEDQDLQRRMIAALLREAGYQVLESGSGATAERLCHDHHPELILLDLGLPDIDGIDLLPKLLAMSPLSRVIVLTGQDSVRLAVASLRAGARHYLVKPWDRDELLVVLEREIKAVNHREIDIREGETSIFWGSNLEMSRIRDDLARLKDAPFTAVLLQGETGTGKEVVARELHRLTHNDGALVALNCAAVPNELMESELFGHERGAFTSAESRRRGLIELADHGTLLLDEIGEMAAHLQPKLLRFLENGNFRRVGAESEMRSRCRVIAATHADLEERQKNGLFRPDLYYRLSVVTITLPPLRERLEDLLPLTNFLLGRISKNIGQGPKALSPRAEKAILRHPWPGNVRELANRLERALVLGPGESIEPRDLDLHETSALPMEIHHEILKNPERLRKLLDQHDWNLSQVARLLGIERHRVKYRVKTLGLSKPAKN